MKIFFLIIAILAFTFCFTGCTKEKAVTDKTVEEFIKVLNEYQSQGGSKASIQVEFAANPYNEQGEMHNALLDRFFDEICGKVDPALYIDKFIEMVNLPGNKTGNYYITLFNKVRNSICDEKGYNPTFINKQEYISATGKGLLNSYFTKMNEFLSLRDKIELSKIAEAFLINTDDISKEEKRDMLISFAIYRYSNYFWEEYFDDIPAKAPLTFAQFDAIGLYIAYNSDIEWVQDGASANSFATAFSIVCCVASGGCR
jgi:hypothetical protein